MKQYKKLLPVAIVGLVLILTGCGSQSNNQNSSMKPSESSSSQVQKSSSSQSSENSSSSDDSATSNSKMPQTDQSITKSVNGDHQNFTVDYNKSNQEYAQYSKKTYDNSEKAQKHVGYRNASEDQGLPTTNLGYSIKGAQENGAGQTYITFHMGNWSIAVHSSSNVTGGTTAQDAAKQVVSYLQDHSLPIPNSQGAIYIDTNSAKNNYVKWQDNNSVYHLSGQDQDTLLRMATSVK